MSPEDAGMDLYRSKDWKLFRAEVIRLDGGVCRYCGRGASDGVLLHVHHTEYFPGRKPWEYSHGVCETLCGGCHAAQHGRIPPKFGWEYAGWEDLGGLHGKCECCGKGIRYSFLISHADWVAIEVGEVCCDHLTSSQMASDIVDSKRRYHSRLKRFVSSKRWASYPNDHHRISHKGLTIGVRPVDGSYAIWINGVQGRSRHESLVSAKIAIFEGIESGAVQRYLSGKAKRQ